MSYELYTERLTLRPLAENDADAVTSQISDWDVIRWLGTPPYPYDRSVAESFIQNCKTDSETSTVRVMEVDGQLIGTMGLSAPKDHWGQTEGAFEIGYWIGKSHWGHGYATEAAQAMLTYAFERLHVQEMLASVFTENIGSRKVLEKCGFEYRDETDLFCVPRGEVVTSLRLRLPRSRWHALKMVG